MITIIFFFFWIRQIQLWCAHHWVVKSTTPHPLGDQVWKRLRTSGSIYS